MLQKKKKKKKKKNNPQKKKKKKKKKKPYSYCFSYAANCSWSFVYSVIILRVFLLPCVYCFTMCVLLPYIL